MMVMFFGVTDMHMQMILLVSDVQLMMHSTISLRRMNATPCLCRNSSPLCHILCPSSVNASPKPVHRTSDRPTMSRW
jgi:hypothetical protein